MSEIPEDLMLIARSVAFEMCPFSDEDERAAFRAAKWPAVARSLMQERERCATIAYVEAIKHCSARDGMTLIGHPVGFSIAAAIRTPSTGEEQSGGGTGPY